MDGAPREAPDDAWEALQGFVAKDKGGGVYTVERWTRPDWSDAVDAKGKHAQRGPAPVGVAILSVNGARYEPSIAFKRLRRVAALQADAVPRDARDLEDLDRVVANTTLRYALDGSGTAVLVNDGVAPKKVVLPGTKGTVVSAARGSGGVLRVHWDGHGDLGAALVRPSNRLVQVAAEVVFDFLTHGQLVKETLDKTAPARWLPPTVVVGTGSWYRTSRHEVRACASKMFNELNARFKARVVRLTGLEEASFEETATLFAHGQKRGWDKPDAVISGGSGSTQISYASPPDVGDEVVVDLSREKTGRGLGGLGASLRGGGSHFPSCTPATVTGVWPDDTPPSYEVRIEDRRDNVTVASDKVSWPRGARGPSAPCLVPLGNRRGRTILDEAPTVKDGYDQWCDETDEKILSTIVNSGFQTGAVASATCMATCYYAALYAGIVSKADDKDPKEHRVGDARRLFQETASKILDAAARHENKGSTSTRQTFKLLAREFKNKKENMDQNLANMAFQIKLCDLLQPPGLAGNDVMVRYVRDWDLDGVAFRTTWSSGFYLQNLVRARPDLLSEKDTGFYHLI